MRLKEFEDFLKKYKECSHLKKLVEFASENLDSLAEEDEPLSKSMKIDYTVNIGNNLVSKVGSECKEIYRVTLNIDDCDPYLDVINLYVAAKIAKLSCGVPYEVVLRFEDESDMALFEVDYENMLDMIKTFEPLKDIKYELT
jgi:hypothetical protein